MVFSKLHNQKNVIVNAMTSITGLTTELSDAINIEFADSLELQLISGAFTSPLTDITGILISNDGFTTSELLTSEEYFVKSDYTSANSALVQAIPTAANQLKRIGIMVNRINAKEIKLSYDATGAILNLMIIANLEMQSKPHYQ